MEFYLYLLDGSIAKNTSDFLKNLGYSRRLFLIYSSLFIEMDWSCKIILLGGKIYILLKIYNIKYLP